MVDGDSTDGRFPESLCSWFSEMSSGHSSSLSSIRVNVGRRRLEDDALRGDEDIDMETAEEESLLRTFRKIPLPLLDFFRILLLLAGLESMIVIPGAAILSFTPSTNMLTSKLPHEEPPSVDPLESVVGRVVEVASLWIDLVIVE